jgi:hypothetical protein
MVEIKLGEVTALFVVPVPLDFAFGQGDRSIQVAKVTFAQQLIVKHRCQGWRDAHR